MKIELSEETINDIKENLSNESPCGLGLLQDMVGKKYFFREVNYHTLGRVKNIISDQGKVVICLENASWIPCAGRLADFIKSANYDEIEPIGDYNMNFDHLSSFMPWKHDLPKEQK